LKPKELERMGRLVGDWIVDLTGKMPDGTSVRGKGALKATELSLDRGIRTEMRLEIDGLGPYHEDDLWSFDQWEKKMHLYSVTSSGAVHDHSGSWKDDRTLALHWDGLFEGKPATEDVALTWVSDHEMHAHEVNTSEGQPGPVFEYVCRKQ